MIWASCARLATGAVAVAFFVGCSTRPLSHDGGSTGGLGNIGGSGTAGMGGTGADGTPFVPTRGVDMLFVIKNSGSTRLIQNNLLSNFPTFLATLQNTAGLPDLHLAVITSDMGAGDGSISGCSAMGGDAGKFQYVSRYPAGLDCTSNSLMPGQTFISNVGGQANYTGQLASVFDCIAGVGSAGCGFAQPLASIARALGIDGQPPPTENQGFLRPDAFLFIAVLMDEDDCSVPAGSGLFDISSGTTLDSPLGPLGEYRCNEFGHLCNGMKPPRRAPTGSVNDVVMLNGCMSAEGAGMLVPLATLTAQLRALKGHPDQQILVSVITGPSAPYTVYWHNPSTADSGPWPEITHTCTAPDGSFADPAVRINQWARSFGANGQVFSVCEQSYAPLLQAMADMIGQQLPPPASMP